MRFQSGIQIILVIISIVIIMTVIKPEFAEIKTKQDASDAYAIALEQVSETNQVLQDKLYEAENMSAVNRNALDLYLPDEIDPIRVSRDVSNILISHSVLLQNISFEEEVLITTLDGQGQLLNDSQQSAGLQQGGAIKTKQGGFISQQFTIDMVGDYPSMKRVLQDIERSGYPLRILNFEFETEGDSPLFLATLEVETYALSNN